MSVKRTPRSERGVDDMFEVKYLVFIWRKCPLGFWFRAPKLRTAHVDRAAVRRLGRVFTFEDMMGATRAAE